MKKNFSYNTYQLVSSYENGIIKVKIKRTETKTKAGPKNVGFRLKHLLCRLLLSLCFNVTVLAGILFLLHPPGLHRSYLRSPAEAVSISNLSKEFSNSNLFKVSVIFKEKEPAKRLKFLPNSGWTKMKKITKEFENETLSLFHQLYFSFC